MPIKVIFFGATLVVAVVGIIVYENREPIIEFADLSRRKLADLLRRVADNISTDSNSHHLEEPLSARPLSDPFVDPPVGKSSAIAFNAPTLRHRRDNSTDFSTPSGTPPSLPARLILSPVVVPPTPVQIDAEFSESYDSAMQGQGAGMIELRELPRMDSVPSESERTVSEGPGTPRSDTGSHDEVLWSSIQEWQEQTTVSNARSSSPSLAGSGADDDDVVSDFGGSVPESVGSWTEVASEFSEDH